MKIRSFLHWDSIITRVLIMIAFLTLLIGSLSVFFGYFYLQSKVSEQIEDKVASLIATVEPSAQVGLYINDLNLLNEITEGLLKNEEFRHVAICDAEGRPLAGNMSHGEPLPDEMAPALMLSKAISSPFNPEEKVGEIRYSINQGYISKEVSEIVAKVGSPMLFQSLFVALAIGLYLSLFVAPKLRNFLKALRKVDIQQQQYLDTSIFDKDYEFARLVEYQNELLTKFYQLIERERVLSAELEKEREEVRLLNEVLENKVEQRTQELLQAKNSAEAANRVKSEFLASMSHELRTPLNAVIGFAQLLEMDDLNEDQADSLHHILQGANYLLTMVNDVLDFAKIEAHELTLDIESLNLRKAIHQCCDTIDILAEKRHIALTFECDDAIMIDADSHKLRQVILNLLSNAVKYNHERGSIHVQCLRLANGTVRISVSDTGVGVPESLRGRLFVPFERLSHENSNIQGTGLGLAITLHLVQAMGGAIGYESKDDEGSIFWVEFSESDLDRE